MTFVERDDTDEVKFVQASTVVRDGGLCVPCAKRALEISPFGMLDLPPVGRAAIMLLKHCARSHMLSQGCDAGA